MKIVSLVQLAAKPREIGRLTIQMDWLEEMNAIFEIHNFIVGLLFDRLGTG
jgi:hypothetical protein